MTMLSREAYAAIVDKLPEKREKVFTVIRNGGGRTIREICEYLNWTVNTVSPRVFELAEAGLIKDSGIARDGQTAWIVSRPEEIEALRAARAAARKAKLDAKLKALEELQEAVKRVKDHKAELFEDGVSADLAAEGIVSITGAFMAGYDECHRVMLELLDAEVA